MEDVLWYVLVGTRGGQNRARILRTLDEQPRNANRLAETLDFDYRTAQHHLEVLVENGVITRAGDGYGAVYRISDRARTLGRGRGDYGRGGMNARERGRNRENV